MDEDAVDHAGLFDEAQVDTEQLTLLLVTGGSRAAVLELLGAAAGSEAEAVVFDDDQSSYAAAEIPGGVVAIEHTGYADPSLRVLEALSGLGGRAAVTRSNIQAHERFGCARDGTTLFDADEFMYVEADDKADVPAELRDLFDSAWIDLDEEEADVPEEAGIDVGLRMAMEFTGLQVTSEDLRRAVEQGYHRVPMLTYPG